MFYDRQLYTGAELRIIIAYTIIHFQALQFKMTTDKDTPPPGD